MGVCTTPACWRLRENRFLDKILLTYTINYCYTKRLNRLGDLAVFQNFPTARVFFNVFLPEIGPIFSQF